MSAENANRLGRRLSRILVMLPYAIQHPGVSVDELSKKFNVRKNEILDDLQLVFFCGLPGYGPGDLIDVMIDDDRIYVRMADYFSAPLRLTPSEALALYAGAAAIAELPGMEGADALKRALTKLGRALGTGIEGDGAGIGVKVDPGPSEHMQTLQRSLSERRRVHLEYRSASRGELSDRDVDPWGLIAAMGHWYLVGHDHLSGEERMFRVDRIKAVESRDEAADIPADFDPQRYKGAFLGEGAQPTMTIEISPAAARWFEDYYPVASARTLDDGWREVELIASGERWAATLLLQLGADVRNVKPQQTADAATELGGRIAARHQ
ncbi:MAG: helix-turn-helix transcriptional regulator [Actinomycetota bacterium]